MKEHQLKFLKVKIMPRCTVDADFLKSVLEDAKAAGRWADASYQLFLKKGKKEGRNPRTCYAPNPTGRMYLEHSIAQKVLF